MNKFIHAELYKHLVAIYTGNECVVDLDELTLFDDEPPDDCADAVDHLKYLVAWPAFDKQDMLQTASSLKPILDVMHPVLSQNIQNCIALSGFSDMEWEPLRFFLRMANTWLQVNAPPVTDYERVRIFLIGYSNSIWGICNPTENGIMYDIWSVQGAPDPCASADCALLISGLDAHSAFPPFSHISGTDRVIIAWWYDIIQDNNSWMHAHALYAQVMRCVNVKQDMYLDYMPSGELGAALKVDINIFRSYCILFKQAGPLHPTTCSATLGRIARLAGIKSALTHVLPVSEFDGPDLACMHAISYTCSVGYRTCMREFTPLLSYIEEYMFNRLKDVYTSLNLLHFVPEHEIARYDSAAAALSALPKLSIVCHNHGPWTRSVLV